MPVLFTPVKIGNTHYVDGGLLMNLPVSTIRNECEKVPQDATASPRIRLHGSTRPGTVRGGYLRGFGHPLPLIALH